jgi:hypothetical protein
MKVGTLVVRIALLSVVVSAERRVDVTMRICCGGNARWGVGNDD